VYRTSTLAISVSPQPGFAFWTRGLKEVYAPLRLSEPLKCAFLFRVLQALPKWPFCACMRTAQLGRLCRLLCGDNQCLPSALLFRVAGIGNKRVDAMVAQRCFLTQRVGVEHDKLRKTLRAYEE
jgi:hypothetical protein